MGEEGPLWVLRGAAKAPIIEPMTMLTTWGLGGCEKTGGLGGLVGVLQILSMKTPPPANRAFPARQVFNTGIDEFLMLCVL